MDNLTVKAVATDSLLGVNDISDEATFSVYPNPATNFITVSSNINLAINSIEMFDINGRMVKRISYKDISNPEVNISDIAAGVYMMKISSNNGVATKKIIKQ